MKIVVVVRQLPDLIEPLEIASSGAALELDGARFIVNEYDDHALEQALLLKEKLGGTVTVVALDFGDVDTTLYAAAAKGVERIIKIPYEDPQPPAPKQAARLFAQVIKPLEADLVLAGVQSYDELEGHFSPLLALALNFPYLGLIRGVEAGDDGSTVRAYKEFPGAAKARMTVRLPALLGILTASQPPRYVPISRIRAVMKTAKFDEYPAEIPSLEPFIQLRKLYPPEVSERAQIIEGTTEEIAAKIAEILEEKGILK
jgi:electron transfer flavoprotein beta subunit